MMYSFRSSSSQKPGFVLVKTVIAITILALSLTVSVKLLGLSAKSIQQNRQRTTALFLAQQCLEWTRNLRDTSWRQNLPWDCGFQVGPVAPTWDFVLRPGGVDTGICGQPLGYEVLPAVGGNTNVAGTHFERVLTADRQSPEKILFRCEVSWPEGEIDMTHLLTNWKE